MDRDGAGHIYESTLQGLGNVCSSGAMLLATSAGQVITTYWDISRIVSTSLQDRRAGEGKVNTLKRFLTRIPAVDT